LNQNVFGILIKIAHFKNALVKTLLIVCPALIKPVHIILFFPTKQNKTKQNKTKVN
jgi:hypothetical protein